MLPRLSPSLDEVCARCGTCSPSTRAATRQRAWHTWSASHEAHPDEACEHCGHKAIGGFLPNTSAVLYAAGDLRIENRPEPKPADGEVIVEVAAVGICGSDVHYYDHGRIGDYIVVDPMIVGHESAGVIVDVGPAVDRDRIGQLVAVEPGVPDRSCPQCLAGRYNLCPQMRFFATPPIDGAFAEQVVVHQAFAHPVPDSIGDDAAALLEPLSVGVWACRKGHITAGSRVLVTGAG